MNSSPAPNSSRSRRRSRAKRNANRKGDCASNDDSAPIFEPPAPTFGKPAPTVGNPVPTFRLPTPTVNRFAAVPTFGPPTPIIAPHIAPHIAPPIAPPTAPTFGRGWTVGQAAQGFPSAAVFKTAPPKTAQPPAPLRFIDRFPDPDRVNHDADAETEKRECMKRKRDDSNDNEDNRPAKRACYNFDPGYTYDGDSAVICDKEKIANMLVRVETSIFEIELQLDALKALKYRITHEIGKIRVPS